MKQGVGALFAPLIGETYTNIHILAAILAGVSTCVLYSITIHTSLTALTLARDKLT
ncbi:MAG: hypothetical protein QW486_06940 [Candidatus Bathyarchaeia archaeon]